VDVDDGTSERKVILILSQHVGLFENISETTSVSLCMAIFMAQYSVWINWRANITSQPFNGFNSIIYALISCCVMADAGDPSAAGGAL
jgi:hypothetical protein